MPAKTCSAAALRQNAPQAGLATFSSGLRGAREILCRLLTPLN
jgi:hypothetical protein